MVMPGLAAISGRPVDPARGGGDCRALRASRGDLRSAVAWHGVT
ncbi:hypothetical protein ABZT06_04580 [Streptomyces sp. NPDC005483]